MKNSDEPPAAPSRARNLSQKLLVGPRSSKKSAARKTRAHSSLPLPERLDYDLAIEPGVKLPRTTLPLLHRYIPQAWHETHSLLASLSIALVGDQTMSDLHQQFMNIPGPTDVLTFELDYDSQGHCTAGEVVVCVPEAKRRCADHAVTLDHELLLYVLHGMLHLAGLDDRTDAAFKKMHRTEDQILTRIGIGPVFAAHAQATTADPEPAAASHASGSRRKISSPRTASAGSARARRPGGKGK